MYKSALKWYSLFRSPYLCPQMCRNLLCLIVKVRKLFETHLTDMIRAFMSCVAFKSFSSRNFDVQGRRWCHSRLGDHLLVGKQLHLFTISSRNFSRHRRKITHQSSLWTMIGTGISYVIDLPFAKALLAFVSGRSVRSVGPSVCPH